MTESEKRVKAISLYDNWCETDTEDTLEIYCYEQGIADAEEYEMAQEYKRGYEEGRADALKDAKLFNELMEIVRKDDNKIINEYKLKCQKMFRELQFKTGKAWFDFDAGIDRCFEILDKVEKQVKEQG